MLISLPHQKGSEISLVFFFLFKFELKKVFYFFIFIRTKIDSLSLLFRFEKGIKKTGPNKTKSF